MIESLCCVVQRKSNCLCVKVSCCSRPAQPNTIFDCLFLSCLLQGSLYASRLANSPHYRCTPHHGLIVSSDWLWLRALQPHKISPRLSLSLCFCPGYREGFLWKRGRDNGQFLSRKFILAEREGALKYFNKQDVSEMKSDHVKIKGSAVIKIIWRKKIYMFLVG